MAKQDKKTEARHVAPQTATPQDDAQPVGLPKRGRQRAGPLCPYCGTPCKSGKTEALFTRYYCDREKGGCGQFSAKIPRPELPRGRHHQQEDHSAR